MKKPNAPGLVCLLYLIASWPRQVLVIRNLGRLLCACGLFLSPVTAFAGGSVGIDYLSSEVVVSGFRDSETRIESSGPGISLALDVGDQWRVSFNHSSIDSDGAKETSTVRTRSIGVQSESSSTGLGLSYYGDNFWASLRYRQSEDEQSVRGFSRLNTELDLDIDQQQDAQSFTIEIGRDWLFGNWSPALSLSLSQQNLDVERTERLDTSNLSTFEGLSEELSGTDLGISASVAYYIQLSDSVLLAPNIGLFHQSNLSGDISGIAAFSQSRGGRSFRASQDYREKLNTPEDTSIDFGLNLLAGDWLWSIGTLTSLSDREGENSSSSWFTSLSYAF